jgi:hypothetical protein
MRSVIFLLVTALSLFSCKSKKKILSVDEAISMQEFVESFDDLQLPYLLTDNALLRKSNDSSLISISNLKKFLPDSIYNPGNGKSKHLKVYALGKIPVKENETYLFLKTENGEKKSAYLLVLDKKLVFKTSMLFVHTDDDRNTSITGNMDRRYNITISKQYKRGTESYYTNSSYYYAGGNEFVLSAIDTNEKPVKEELVNPIDTLTRKMKFSADYFIDQKNLVSVRDGRNERERILFISLSKNNGACTGEIKGSIIKTGNNSFRFSAPGDPCQVDLLFTAVSVMINEVTGCGNHRGMDCLYKGTYLRKKEPKPKTPGNKKLPPKK